MRRVPVLVVIVLLAMAALISPAGAQNSPAPQTLAAAEELFLLVFETSIHQLNARAVETAWPGIETSLRGKNPNIGGATLAELRGEFERIRLERLRVLMREVPVIYSRHLSGEEIRELVSFYSTPAGRKLLQVLPDLFSEMLANVLPRLPSVASDTNELFLLVLRERGLVR